MVSFIPILKAIYTVVSSCLMIKDVKSFFNGKEGSSDQIDNSLLEYIRGNVHNLEKKKTDQANVLKEQAKQIGSLNAKLESISKSVQKTLLIIGGILLSVIVLLIAN